MNGTELIRARRSVRRFKAGEPVQPEHLHLMLEAAMMAPSACNTRPWEFVVVRSRPVLDSIMKLHPYTKMLATAALAVVVCGRPDRQQGRCAEFWPQDCGAAIENLLLQAVELGYGGCWCGCWPVEDRALALKELLGTQGMPLAVVALGVPDEAPAARGFYDPALVREI